MRVLITCHNGYIWSVLAPLVRGTFWRPLVHIESLRWPAAPHLSLTEVSA